MTRRPLKIKDKISINLMAWLLYDFANSANNTIIQTFIFASYFISKIAADKVTGVSKWGAALGLTGVAVALCGPFLGAIVDQGKKRKEWLTFFTLLAIASIALMWFMTPGNKNQNLALILVAMAAGSSEIAFIFYNSMLPEFAPAESLGKWSGWGWAAGYIGGVLSLAVCFLFFIEPFVPIFYFDQSSFEGERLSFIFAACWYAVFAFPLLLLAPREKSEKNNLRELVQNSFKQIRDFFVSISVYKNIFLFLAARMFFIDGLISLFAFGGIYAAAQFNMQGREIIIFGIVLNIAAGIGAITFSFLDDIYGGKAMILTALVGLIISGSFSLLAWNKTYFWLAAACVGFFVGPAQASSRSFLARVAPKHLLNQMFGFFALSGRITAFLGPFLVGFLTYLSGSLRIGMSMIIVLLCVGFFLMLKVHSDKNNG